MPKKKSVGALLNTRPMLRTGEPLMWCHYCRGLVTEGDSRRFTVGWETVYVHRRHPKLESEEGA
jgi:hypothetical protein